MGYSIMAPFKSEEDKRKMKSFMEKNYRSLKEITKHLNLKDFELEEHVPPYDDLSYGPEKNIPVLGFDYGAGEFDEERDYHFTICYWMAVRFGDRKTFENNLNMPYIIYDGYEEWLLFINKERDKKFESVEVTEDGYREMSSLSLLKKSTPKIANLFMKKLINMRETIDESIHNELKRLTREWENYLNKEERE